MNWLSGPVSFVRFRPDVPRPRQFDGEHLDRLRDHQAGRPRLASADGVECGWTAGSHVLDTDFAELKNVFPDHLLWDLRVDTDRLPADLLKAYYEVELKALAKDNPSGFASARQKREARQTARERLEEEAKDGRFLKRKCDPALWDSLRNTVYFASASTPAQDRFASLFEQTFGGGLTPITAGTLAAALDARAGDERPSEFVAGWASEDGPAWQANSDGPPDFLGNEFLLWLWYYADTEADELPLPDGTAATFMFSGGVKVEDPRGQTGSGVMNSDSAVRLPEARVAVAGGKLPRQAALTVVRADDQFSFKLQAETLAVTSAKLPAPPEDATGRARDEHRLQAVRDLAEGLDQMFAAFLRRRLGGGWADELRGVQRWLRAGGRQKAEA